MYFDELLKSSFVKATSTSAAQHKTQANVRQTDEKMEEVRWRRGRVKSLFAFSQIPSLLLVVNSSILILSTFMDQQEIRVFGLACAHNTITGILLLCGPVHFGPAQHARLYLVLYHSTRTVMVQLPMHVLHDMCYSLPPVVMISHLLWFTTARLGVALTNLLTSRSFDPV